MNSSVQIDPANDLFQRAIFTLIRFALNQSSLTYVFQACMPALFYWEKGKRNDRQELRSLG
ncbi:hypothetical protein MD484_g8037, partial [Candolleomyces efflorescens]